MSEQKPPPALKLHVTPNADGTISQAAAETYDFYSLSPLATSPEGRTGFRCYGYYNLFCLENGGRRIQFVRGWKYHDASGDEVEMFVYRDDTRRIVLAVHSDGAPPDLVVRAIMTFPWGPAGVGGNVEYTNGE